MEEQSREDASEAKAREWWNAWSDRFQEEGDIDVGIAWGPGAPFGDDLGLLGELDGKKAVELGCGGAQFGLAVAERGAEVTGVDISAAQLAHARALADERGTEMAFVEASVTDVPLPDSTYDLAFSAFAFQWVEDLRAAFEEAHRVLVEGGRLVFSVDHPYYKIVDSETHEFEASYFEDAPRRAYSERLDAEMVVYRRRVSEVVNLLLDAGFTVEGMREPGYDDPDEYESTFGSFEPELMAKVPPTIVYAARKSGERRA